MSLRQEIGTLDFQRVIEELLTVFQVYHGWYQKCEQLLVICCILNKISLLEKSSLVISAQ